jgi:AAA15 family ATPase/GTPase
MEAIKSNLENPYKGLKPYEVGDADKFLGREPEKAELLEIVYSTFLTIIYGKSGIGKTSLLEAGLIPKLITKNFCVIRLLLDYNEAQFHDQTKIIVTYKLRKNSSININ